MNMESKTNRTGRPAVGGRLLFWGQSWLETMGLAVGISLVLCVLYGFGACSSLEDVIQMGAVYPYYLLCAGAFLILLMGIGFYQLYFPLMVSMNLPRKRTAGTIIVNILLIVLGVIALAVIIWSLIPGEVSDGGLAVFPLLTGVLFLAASFSLVIGTVMLRWRRIGVVAAVLVYMLIGGCAGFFFAAADSSIVESMSEAGKSMATEMQQGGFNFYIVTAAGVLLFAAAGIFSVMATRKIEVRV